MRDGVIARLLEKSGMTTIQTDRAPSNSSYITVHRGQKINRHLAGYLSLNDFEAAARRRLPRMLYGFISGGAETNAAVRSNAESFQDYCFVPRVLTDVSKRSHRKTLFGRSYAAPFGIAPTGVASICAYRSDLVMARCAAAAEIPAILSWSPRRRAASCPGADGPQARQARDRQTDDATC